MRLFKKVGEVSLLQRYLRTRIGSSAWKEIRVRSWTRVHDHWQPALTMSVQRRYTITCVLSWHLDIQYVLSSTFFSSMLIIPGRCRNGSGRSHRPTPRQPRLSPLACQPRLPSQPTNRRMKRRLVWHHEALTHLQLRAELQDFDTRMAILRISL